MLRRQRKAQAKKTGRRVSYELIPKDTDHGKAMHRLVRNLVDEYHGEARGPAYDVREARIALAWNTSWKADVDGRIVLAKCRKAGDLDRELAPYDFVILLHRFWWEDVHTSQEQRVAVVNHELEHCAVSLDPITGEAKRDERGRPVFRLRKHDLEEFRNVVKWHGLYKGDVEAFYTALVEGARNGFVPCDTCKGQTKDGGWIVSDSGRSMARCECWLQWSTRVEVGKGAAA